MQLKDLKIGSKAVFISRNGKYHWARVASKTPRSITVEVGNQLYKFSANTGKRWNTTRNIPKSRLLPPTPENLKLLQNSKPHNEKHCAVRDYLAQHVTPDTMDLPEVLVNVIHAIITTE